MKGNVTDKIGTVQGKYDTDTNNDITIHNDDDTRNHNNNNNIPIHIDKYMNEQQHQQSISSMNGNIKMNQYYHYHNNNNILYFHFILYRIGTIIIFLCSLFLYLYLLLSKTILSSFYDSIIQFIKSNILLYLIKNPQYIKDKAIIPLITFVLPILLIGTISSILHFYHYNTNNITNIYNIIYHNNNNHTSRIYNNHHNDYSDSYYNKWKRSILSSYILGGHHRCCYQNYNTIYCSCYWNVFVRYSYVFMIYIPLLVYTISSIILKIPKTTDFDDNNNNNMNHDSIVDEVVAVDVISFYNNNVIVSDIANVFGIVGLYCMSFILIPVTKYNYIFQYFMKSQNPIFINQYIHQTIGYCIIITVLLHVLLHIYRWYCIQNENLLYMLLIIPSSCFKSNNSNITTTEMILCLNSTTYDTTPIDCTCYGHVRNLMGTIGTIAIIILSITSSISYIRRYYYTLFYILHVLCSILFFICIILHWNRSIIYLSIGIVYYISGTFPIWIEQSIIKQQQKQSQSQFTSTTSNNNCSYIISTLPLTKQVSYNTTQYQQMNNSILITNIEQIGSSSGNNHNHNNRIIALSFAVSYDTIQQYHCGQYIKLYVPSICQYVSHPFTVNQIIHNNHYYINNNSKPECNNNVLQLRIIFRCIGPFTKQLANELLLVKKTREEHQDEDEQNEQQQSRILQAPATIYIDGLYGIHNRLQQALFDHDHVIFIAGGIGITPYLSLLYNIISFYVTNNNNNMNDCILLLKRITFIWICRDKSLIAYIKREYLNPIIKLYNEHRDIHNNHYIQLEIQIYQTFGINSNNITHYKNRSGSKNGSPIIVPKNVSYTNLEQQQHQIENDDIEIDPIQHQHHQQYSGYYGGNRPFTLSIFFPRNTNLSYINNGNYISFIFFISITWIGLYIIWFCYTRFQSSDTILSRLIAPICIVLYGYIISRLLYWLIVECTIFNRLDWKNCCITKNKYYRKDSNHIVMNDMIHDDDCDENIAISQIKNPIASSSSSGWIPIEAQDDEDEHENNRYTDNIAKINHSPDQTSTNVSSPKLYKSSSLELGIVHCNNYHDALHDQINSNSTIPTINNSNSNNNTNITIEMLHGRPNIPDILHHLFHTTTNSNSKYDNSNNENQFVGLYVCGPKSLMGIIRDTIYCSRTTCKNKEDRNGCCSIAANGQQCSGGGCCTYHRHRHHISLYEESFEI